MSRVILSMGIVLLGMFAAACSSAGVGDPCMPARPEWSTGQNSCGPDAGCFSGSEIYIETRSLQCRTRVCMVYKWDEVSAPEQRPQRVFCTCRCGGEGDPTSFCQCDPEHFSCVSAFIAGNEGVRGSYCVRNEALPNAGDAGTAP